MKFANSIVALGALAATSVAQSDAFVASYYIVPGRMESFDGAGALVTTSSGGTPARYVGAAIDAAGNWVTSRRVSEGIEFFDDAGVSIGGFDTPQVNGSASDVSLFADGTVTVCNLGGGGVHLYSPSGVYLGAFPTGPNAWGSTVDSQDRLWVIELTGNPSPPSTIYCYSRAGTLLSSFVVNFQGGDIVVAQNGELWMTDVVGRLVRLSSNGTELASFPTSLGPNSYGLALMSDGTL